MSKDLIPGQHVMESKDSRASNSNRVLDWPGPHTVVIPRAESGFGFTLRHFVVYPPRSVLEDSTNDPDHYPEESYPRLVRERSLEPQDTIFVKSVKEDSPADYAGLNTGDRIIAINGESISGKSYRDVIATVHQSAHTLKLLVVPKDEDILQMAYQSQTGDSMYSSSGSLSDNIRLSVIGGQHQLSHSSDDLVHGTNVSQRYGFGPNEAAPVGQHEARYSYPLSQWGPHGVDFRGDELHYAKPVQAQRVQPLMSDSFQNQTQSSRNYSQEQQARLQSQNPGSGMASNITCNIQGKSKYSFGLYFPPKSSSAVAGSNSSSSSGSRTISAESLGQSVEKSSEASGLSKSQTFQISQRTGGSGHRKSSLDESSALSSSAKSRDFFIKYSSDKAASDNRNRYSPRYSSYERYSTDPRPTYIMSRSQTVSSIAPAKTSTAGQSGKAPSDYMKSSQGGSDTNRPCQYIPVLSEKKVPGNTESLEQKSYGQSPYFSEQSDSASGSRTFVVRIPYEQQQQHQQPFKVPESSHIRQNYGTTFALTRSPTAAHIEIQKSIGKPIVSQRKYQFESGRNENTPPPGNGGYNRYKTEIEKIRTQPKFSSIALRKASFEQSPERDPPGYDEVIEAVEQPSEYPFSSIETAQPTVKVRKISSERYNAGSPLHMAESMQKQSGQGGNYQDSVPIRIYVSPGSTNAPSSPIVEIVPMFPGEGNSRHGLDTEHNVNKSALFKSLKDGHFHSHSPSNSSAGSSSGTGVGGSDGTMADSGVWVKSYHSSSDMLDEADGGGGVGDSVVYPVDTAMEQDGTGLRLSRPARKTSYLSAVNAPVNRNVTVESHSALENRSNYVQTPQQLLAQSQALPYPSGQTSSILHPPRPSSPQPHPFPQLKSRSADSQSFSSFPSSGSSHSLSSLSSGNVPVASVAPTVMSSSDSAMTLGIQEGAHSSLGSAVPAFSGVGTTNMAVTMRKKVQESQEDQANKLHRRTSYLMATARDRANAVPIEQAFSSPQVVTDHKPQQSGSGGPVRHQSSVKLNKFFGEMIPSIAEGQEEPPEVIRKGPLSCKISVIEGKKCSDRTWKPVYAILRQTELFLTRDKDGGSTSSSFEDQHIPLRSCMVEFARDYAKKKKNVFRLSTHNECEYLFQTEDRGTMLCWIQGIKSINEPEKAEKMEEMIASEREKNPPQPVEVSIVPSTKLSPQMGHKAKKLSALSFKSKLASSPSMRRKKSNATEKDKEESIKKSWKGRIPMMKSLKKHSEDSQMNSMAEHDYDPDKMQFGVPLEDCFPSPHNEYVPLIVELCTRIVEARGLEVVGVYRVPGNSAAVTALTEEFNRGIDSVNIDNEKLLDINVISSLLKSFFRKLPEPLIPTDQYDLFIEANRFPDEDKRKLKIKRLLYLLPSHNNETFKHMAEHLNKVASYGNINKMDAKNLAIMFGPTLVRKKGDDTVSLVTDMSDQCRIVESIILHHDWFFSPWDHDNYIPMETTVETVPLDDGQAALKDDDEEADSAISTKEIISSIVGAASKKLRSQQQKSFESLDLVESSSCITTSTMKDSTIDEVVYMSSYSKSISSIGSSRSASEEFLDRNPVLPPRFSSDHHPAMPLTTSEPDFQELEYADASSPQTSSFPRHLSEDSLVDKNDELEISHGLPTSLSRDAIHNTLKRIGNDVSALLHTFEQKQLKERERRRKEQEMIEKEHLRTRLELEQEENHSVEDWLAWKGVTGRKMPDLISSSYVGENFPYELGSPSPDVENREKHDKKSEWRTSTGSGEFSGQTASNVASVPPQITGVDKSHLTVQQPRMFRGGSHEDILSQSRRHETQKPVQLRSPSQRKMHDNPHRHMHLAVGAVIQRPSSIRNSFGKRHGSLDSLIDMIDKQDKRASWASSDSEDGSDLLTSITTTFDQKLQILLNPKYKLTGAGRKNARNEAAGASSGGGETAQDADFLRHLESVKSKSSTSSNAKQVYTVAALLDSDRPFRNPSLHRSTKSDPKIGIASRFERNDISRTASSLPITATCDTIVSQAEPKKSQLPDFKTFLGKPVSRPKDLSAVVLTQPRKLQSSGHSAASDRRAIAKIDKVEKSRNFPQVNKGDKIQSGVKESESSSGQREDSAQMKKATRHLRHRRHTVGGVEDFDHISALSQICGGTAMQESDKSRYRLSAWEQLQPAVKDPGPPADRNMQAWIQKERLRGSTPDLSCQGKQ